MKISKDGIELIKSYEGLRLKAYKPVATEKYYTIGYGHYGADVDADMVITKEQANLYLYKDVVQAVDDQQKQAADKVKKNNTKILFFFTNLQIFIFSPHLQSYKHNKLSY